MQHMLKMQIGCASMVAISNRCNSGDKTKASSNSAAVLTCVAMLRAKLMVAYQVIKVDNAGTKDEISVVKTKADGNNVAGLTCAVMPQVKLGDVYQDWNNISIGNRIEARPSNGLTNVADGNLVLDGI